MSKRVVAFPYLYKEDTLHVVLVTTKSGNQWILPKGHPEKKFNSNEVALIEAYEEAGVLGYPEPKELDRKFTDKENSKSEKLLCYPVLVGKLLNSWEESNKRLRKVVPVAEAKVLVSRQVYRDIIDYFSKQLEK